MSAILKEGYVIRVKRRPNVPVEDDYFIIGDKVIDKDYVFINPAKPGFLAFTHQIINGVLLKKLNYIGKSMDGCLVKNMKKKAIHSFL